VWYLRGPGPFVIQASRVAAVCRPAFRCRASRGPLETSRRISPSHFLTGKRYNHATNFNPAPLMLWNRLGTTTRKHEHILFLCLVSMTHLSRFSSFTSIRHVVYLIFYNFQTHEHGYTRRWGVMACRMGNYQEAPDCMLVFEVIGFSVSRLVVFEQSCLVGNYQRKMARDESLVLRYIDLIF
jgi:hypothetical protein